MDRPQQCLSSLKKVTGRGACPNLGSLKPPRQCIALAQRGRAAGRAASAWAWPGPLSWREVDVKHGQEASSRTVSPSSLDGAPPVEPVANTDQRTNGVSSSSSSALPLDTRLRKGSGDDGSSANGAGRGAVPPSLVPTAVADPAANQPPQRQQPHASAADSVVTFAYGANMNFLTLARREVRVLSRDPAIVVDPGVRLVFKHQGGYATLERAQEAGGPEGAQAEPRFVPYDGRVHGVMYRVTRADFEKLAKREGGYLVEEVQVQTYDGASYTALAFVSNPLFKLPQEVTPTEQYLSRVRDGAADNYLDPAYQAFLSGISTVPGTGLGSEYYNTPSKYMGYSFLIVVALITVAFFFQH